jgi:hypothetical protein
MIYIPVAALAPVVTQPSQAYTYLSAGSVAFSRILINCPFRLYTERSTLLLFSRVNVISV